jgi:ABC-type polysaccharide/polyol phosphate export permease
MPKGTVSFDSSKRGTVAVDEFRSIIRYRDFVFQLIRRDIVSRYKRSILGIVWTMLSPLGMMLVMALVFSQLFKTVADFPVYILSGLVAWNFFAQTTSAAMSQMVWGSSLLHRIYIPRTAFVVSAIGTGVANLMLSLVPLALIMLFNGVAFHWSLLFLPISIVLLAIFSLGVGLLLSAWAVYFPDIAEMYQVILIAWMYLVPIIYPPELIAEQFRFWLFYLNPMYYFIEIFRQPVYQGELPSFVMLLLGLGIALFTLGLGWFVFTSKADEFAYHV